MSRENVDLVRSLYAAWERGDFSSAEWAHPEIEWVIADGPTPGSWTGLAGMLESSRDLMDVWENYRARADEYRQLDDERVLVLIQYSGRGKTSGLELGQMGAEGAHLFHLRDGKVTRFVRYLDRKRALADLGLAPENDEREEAMSRENVEIVRRAVQAAYRRPKPDFDTINALFHPDHVLVAAISGVEGRSYQGAKGFRDYLREMDDVWAGREVRLERVEAINHERVLLVGVFSAHSQRAGVPQEWRGANVMTIREGKVVRTESYLSVEDALAAVGRRE